MALVLKYFDIIRPYNFNVHVTLSVFRVRTQLYRHKSHTHTHRCTHTDTHTHIHTQIHTQMHTHNHTHNHTHRCTHTTTYTQIHTQMHTHTVTHTETSRGGRMSRAPTSRSGRSGNPKVAGSNPDLTVF